MYIDKDLIDLVENSPMKSGGNYGTGMLIVCPKTGKLLLGERTDNHTMCSPGGKVEVGETALQGILRETKEESNITVKDCKLYSYEMHAAENGKNWVSFMFISDSYNADDIKNQESEVGPWDWYTLDEALSMNLFHPTKKAIDRAIEAGLLGPECSDDGQNYIPFVDCPTSGFMSHDSCDCAYSYEEPEQVFTTHQGLPWD